MSSSAAVAPLGQYSFRLVPGLMTTTFPCTSEKCRQVPGMWEPMEATAVAARYHPQPRPGEQVARAQQQELEEHAAPLPWVRTVVPLARSRSQQEGR